MRRVGVLMGYAETDPSAQAQVEALRQELQKLGWEEGRNILIDVRFPAADADRVRAVLTELMSLSPDLLVTNTNLVTGAARGYGFLDRTERPPQGGGGRRICRFDNPTIAAEESVGDEGKAVGVP